MIRLKIAVAAVLLCAAGAGTARAVDDVQRQQCTALRDQGVTPEQKIAACNALIESGDLKGADLGLAYGRLADGQYFANRFEAAIDNYNTGLAIYEKSGGEPRYRQDFYEMRGFAYQGAGRQARALMDFDAVIAMNPDRASARYGRASTYGLAGFAALGREDLDRAVALQPNLVDAYVTRAATAAVIGDIPHAIQDIDYALLLSPDYAGSYYDRAMAYVASGQFERAVADFEKTLGLMHGDALPTGRITRAVVEEQLRNAKTNYENWQAALSASVPPAPPTPSGQIAPSRAVGHSHDCAPLYPNISRMLSEQGDVLVGYDVDDKGTIRNVTLLRSSGSERLDRAALACVSALWRNTPASRDGQPLASPGHQAIVRFSVTQPVSGDDFAIQAQGFASVGDLARALTIFDHAVELAPKSAAIHYRRGLTEYLLGQPDRALADFDQALLLQPGYRDAEDGRDLVHAERPAPVSGHAI